MLGAKLAITRSLAILREEGIRLNAVAYARADAPALQPNIKEKNSKRHAKSDLETARETRTAHDAE